MSSVELVRVCINGTVRGGGIRGSSTPDSLLLVAVVIVAMLVRLSTMEDLLRLWTREVRLSSKGFMSGGILEILRKIIARYIDMIKEQKCRLPLTVLRRKVE